MNSKDSIEIQQDIKTWYISESHKPLTHECFKEWVRRGQKTCYEVAYTDGYQEASEAMYRKLKEEHQDEIDCLKSEILGHKQVYKLSKNEASALQSQILDYRKALEEVRKEMAPRYAKVHGINFVEMHRLVSNVLDKYPSHG